MKTGFCQIFVALFSISKPLFLKESLKITDPTDTLLAPRNICILIG